MPRNSSGIFTLPISAYVPNTTIRSADMNTNLSDIASALTTSLATTGVSSMTGAIKLAAGSAGAPSLTLASDSTTGWYNSAAGTWVYVSSSNPIFTLSSTGFALTGNASITGNLTVGGNIVGGRILGEVVDYTGLTAPSLWLFAFGQAVSRSTYAAYFALVSTTYGVGDGATTFNLPDYRGRIGVGRDDMGGVAANRITLAGSGIVGTTLGAVGGEQTHVLITAELAVHGHGFNDPGHFHGAATAGTNGGATGANFNAFTSPSGNTTSVVTGATIGTAGSGAAHNNTQPTIIINKILYVGV